MRKIYLIDSPGVVMGNYGETDEEKVLKGNYVFSFINFRLLFNFVPSFVYSWSITHILEHEFFCLGHLGCACSREKRWI